MNQIQEGVNYVRAIGTIIIFATSLIFLCCCTAGFLLHTYLVDKRDKEIEIEEVRQEVENIL